jgi:hypothetical protein
MFIHQYHLCWLNLKTFSLLQIHCPYTEIDQKNEVEQLIKSMLQDGIIQPSNNPYSSPAILVRKKDGSWRMCIDYRELNSQTVKNKFQIPVVDAESSHTSKHLLMRGLQMSLAGLWISRPVRPV